MQVHAVIDLAGGKAQEVTGKDRSRRHPHEPVKVP